MDLGGRDDDHVITQVHDGEYIITTKQPFAKNHFFVEEELDTQVESYQVGQTITMPVDDFVEESKTACVV